MYRHRQRDGSQDGNGEDADDGDACGNPFDMRACVQPLLDAAFPGKRFLGKDLTRRPASHPAGPDPQPGQATASSSSGSDTAPLSHIASFSLCVTSHNHCCHPVRLKLTPVLAAAISFLFGHADSLSLTGARWQDSNANPRPRRAMMSLLLPSRMPCLRRLELATALVWDDHLENDRIDLRRPQSLAKAKAAAESGWWDERCDPLDPQFLRYLSPPFLLAELFLPSPASALSPTRNPEPKHDLDYLPIEEDNNKDPDNIGGGSGLSGNKPMRPPPSWPFPRPLRKLEEFTLNGTVESVFSARRVGVPFAFQRLRCLTLRGGISAPLVWLGAPGCVVHNEPMTSPSWVPPTLRRVVFENHTVCLAGGHQQMIIQSAVAERGPPCGGRNGDGGDGGSDSGGTSGSRGRGSILCVDAATGVMLAAVVRVFTGEEAAEHSRHAAAQELERQQHMRQMPLFVQGAIPEGMDLGAVLAEQLRAPLRASRQPNGFAMPGFDTLRVGRLGLTANDPASELSASWQLLEGHVGGGGRLEVEEVAILLTEFGNSAVAMGTAGAVGGGCGGLARLLGLVAAPPRRVVVMLGMGQYGGRDTGTPDAAMLVAAALSVPRRVAAMLGRVRYGGAVQQQMAQAGLLRAALAVLAEVPREQLPAEVVVVTPVGYGVQMTAEALAAARRPFEGTGLAGVRFRSAVRQALLGDDC